MLTTIQHEILIGILLGDANLQTFNGGSTYRLRCLQGEKNKEYLYSLYEHFSMFVNTPPALLTEKNGTRVYKKYYFNTLTSEIFTSYGNLFYFNGVKIVPSNLYDLITPRSLAYWYMDDGALKWKNRNNGVRFCTDSFKKEEVELLISILVRKFGLIASLNKNGLHFRIGISSKSFSVFKELVIPYMHENMIYKLNR